MAHYTLTFLGTGTSTGVPVVGCRCRVCRSKDRRNRRSRSSLLIESGGSHLLIDTSPDFRSQALAAGINSLDAVFWTHAHADHLHGLDDLRPLTWSKVLPGYASAQTASEITTRFSYLWKETQKGGGKARIALSQAAPGDRIQVGKITMIPVPVFHGKLEIFGWRFGPAAYITDVSRIPAASYELLQNLKVLIIGALRFRSHPTHMTVSRALEEIEKIDPEQAYLTHIDHEASHRQLMKAMPRNVHPGYDGLAVRVPSGFDDFV